MTTEATTNTILVHAERVLFGMLDTKSRQIGAAVDIYRYADGMHTVSVTPTRNSFKHGHTKVSDLISDVVEVNCEIRRRVTAMFKRYAKKERRLNFVTADECVHVLLWDGVCRDGLGRTV